MKFLYFGYLLLLLFLFLHVPYATAACQPKTYTECEKGNATYCLNHGVPKGYIAQVTLHSDCTYSCVKLNTCTTATSPTPTTPPSSGKTTGDVTFHVEGIDAANSPLTSPTPGKHTAWPFTLSVYNGSNMVATYTDTATESADSTNPLYGTFHNASFNLGSLASGTYTFSVTSPFGSLGTQIGTTAISITGGKNNILVPTSASTALADIPFLKMGDIDQDGKIDITDYGILRQCYGDNATSTNCTSLRDQLLAKSSFATMPNDWIPGDLNDNGVVDGIDYNIFIREFITNSTSNPSPTATPSVTPSITINPPQNTSKPLLAFYFTWYSPSSWSTQTMSDLPTIQYNSDDDTTFDRQLAWAASSGITGFASSWWGPSDRTDKNFAKLLVHSATLEQSTKFHFASAIVVETHAGSLQGQTNLANGLQYAINTYTNDPHYFHWQGKPVFFFWDPLGQGRTLAEWTAIRKQVDPQNQTFWAAEGVDTSMLDVFDGIYLYSAGDWGLQNGNMDAVDKGFRSKIDSYNSSHHTKKVWAAGVEPGYDDSRVPGRTNPHVIARNNGNTYKTSWNAALGSNPDWITISTFNEWFEGAMIEPSVLYNTLYLDLTGQFAKQWHG